MADSEQPVSKPEIEENNETAGNIETESKPVETPVAADATKTEIATNESPQAQGSAISPRIPGIPGISGIVTENWDSFS